MNASTLRQNLLKKLENTPRQPRCPECGSRMKATYTNDWKCPACGAESDGDTPTLDPTEKMQLIPTDRRPGVTDARRVFVNEEELGVVEQQARKWRAVNKSGLPVASGQVSMDAAVKQLLNWDELTKHPGHDDQKVHGRKKGLGTNASPSPAKKKPTAVGTGKPVHTGEKPKAAPGKDKKAKAKDIVAELTPKKRGKQGQQTFSVPFTPDKEHPGRKNIDVTISHKIATKIKGGQKYDAPDAEDAQTRLYTDVDTLRQKFPEGSAPDIINGMIGAQTARAKAYIERTNDPACTDQMKQMLHYKAQQIIDHAEQVLAPALSRAKSQHRAKAQAKNPKGAPEAAGI